MNNDHMYMRVLRLGAGAGAITLWLVSIQFSVAGFSITLPELVWVGWALAGTVTILQLIFNKGVYSNPTLFAAGILAYVYGVTTNIMGIMRAQQILDNLLNNFTDDLGYYIPRTVMAIVLALVIEIVPEALFLWAIFTDKANVGDFVTSILRGTNLSQKKGKNVRKSVRKPVPNAVHGHGQDDFGQNRTKSKYGTGHVLSGQKKLDGAERIVISHCRKHFDDNGNVPSVRAVAKATGISKTKVGEIMKPLRQQWNL